MMLGPDQADTARRVVGSHENEKRGFTMLVNDVAGGIWRPPL
jgi:hypothetical protein